MKKSKLFAPLGFFYGAAVKVRNEFYERGIFRAVSLGAPTISVGNLTVGGTGKTPLVCFVAEVLAAQGETVCILSRGYKRENARERVLVSDGKRILADAGRAGDEPLELARKLLGKAFVVADANRAAAGNWARKKFGVTAFVLDDAFQHRRVKRDLDIVCIDATNAFGNYKLLPQGILRETLKSLERADLTVVTRANLVGKMEIEKLKTEISKFNSNNKIFVSENKFSNLIELNSFSAALPNAEGNKKNAARRLPATAYLAFCALGNPQNFFAQLRRENFNVAAVETFPDHYFYTQKDIEKLEEKARESGAQKLITTAKDAGKLRDLKFNLPCAVAEIALIFDDEAEFKRQIKSVIYQENNSRK